MNEYYIRVQNMSEYYIDQLNKAFYRNIKKTTEKIAELQKDTPKTIITINILKNIRGESFLYIDDLTSFSKQIYYITSKLSPEQKEITQVSEYIKELLDLYNKKLEIAETNTEKSFEIIAESLQQYNSFYGRKKDKIGINSHKNFAQLLKDYIKYFDD